MDSLNSLLIGFYTLLSYSYSQRHTQLTLGSWERDVGRAEKQKRKLFSISFFRAKSISLPFVLHCTPTYFVFVLSATLREGTYLHCQECGSRLRKRLSLKNISLQARTHFH
jgi:hypothetical protein